MKNELIVSRLFILLLIVWICISIGRTFYNVSKLFTEESYWYFLTDEQKRELQFGDLHYLFRFVQKNTKPDSNILFVTNDGKPYYLGRYYLYPTKVVWSKLPNMLWNNNNSFDYVLVYLTKEDLIRKIDFSKYVQGYKPLDSYVDPTRSIGLLYKK